MLPRAQLLLTERRGSSECLGSRSVTGAQPPSLLLLLLLLRQPPAAAHHSWTVASSEAHYLLLDSCCGVPVTVLACGRPYPCNPAAVLLHAVCCLRSLITFCCLRWGGSRPSSSAFASAASRFLRAWRFCFCGWKGGQERRWVCHRENMPG